jgi:hypothetical protein
MVQNKRESIDRHLLIAALRAEGDDIEPVIAAAKAKSNRGNYDGLKKFIVGKACELNLGINPEKLTPKILEDIAKASHDPILVNNACVFALAHAGAKINEPQGIVSIDKGRPQRA